MMSSELMLDSALLSNRLCVFPSHSDVQRKDTKREDLWLSGGHFIRVRWPVLNKKQAKMESSSSRMVLRSSRRLLGCCALLLATVMLVGFMPTSSSPVPGISSYAFKVWLQHAILAFCHFRYISFGFCEPIVSQYHKASLFNHR